MNTDLAAKIHKGIYGKSDKANSPDNDNPDFQSGYAYGLQSTSAQDGIAQEWARRGSPLEITDEFREWKRGWHAARMQKTMIKALANKP